MGSPPRVRGKEFNQPSRIKLHRITPACAGKSPGKMELIKTNRDHPRVCGEKIMSSVLERKLAGSPPRVRGKGKRRSYWLEKSGITPACAGKSSRSLSGFKNDWDHPRVCGEKQIPDRRSGCHPGSPPRVRGKVGAQKISALLPRITPACAGKSSGVSFRYLSREDHPRVCGEKLRLLWLLWLLWGSPPRVRGKGHHLPTAAPARGITPACAGKSKQTKVSVC